MSAGALTLAATIGQLEAVMTRLGNLSELLAGLALAAGSRRLQEGALFVAADYAGDTHRQLAELVDAMGDDVAPQVTS